MKKIEKYIIAIITLIVAGAIGTAIYFGFNKTSELNDNNKNTFELDNNSVNVEDGPNASNDNPSVTKKYINLDVNKYNSKEQFDDIDAVYNIENFYINNKRINVSLNHVESNVTINGTTYGAYLGEYNKLYEYNNHVLLICAKSSGIVNLMVFDGDGILKYMSPFTEEILIDSSFSGKGTLKIYKNLTNEYTNLVNYNMVSSLNPYCTDNKVNAASLTYELNYTEIDSGNFWEMKLVGVECKRYETDEG